MSHLTSHKEEGCGGRFAAGEVVASLQGRLDSAYRVKRGGAKGGNDQAEQPAWARDEYRAGIEDGHPQYTARCQPAWPHAVGDPAEERLCEGGRPDVNRGDQGDPCFG